MANFFYCFLRIPCLISAYGNWYILSDQRTKPAGFPFRLSPFLILRPYSPLKNTYTQEQVRKSKGITYLASLVRAGIFVGRSIVQTSTLPYLRSGREPTAPVTLRPFSARSRPIKPPRSCQHQRNANRPHSFTSKVRTSTQNKISPWRLLLPYTISSIGTPSLLPPTSIRSGSTDRNSDPKHRTANPANRTKYKRRRTMAPPAEPGTARSHSHVRAVH